MADQRKLILICDDDYELSDGIRAVLENIGHQVMQARDGQQGKQMVYNHRPDLVVLRADHHLASLSESKGWTEELSLGRSPTARC